MTEEIICTKEKLKNVILRMDQESESAYSYQAAEIIVQDALIRRHGTFVMESHLRRRQKIISWNC